MLKNKFVIIVLAGLILGLSSCGIFHKGCGCPKFGKLDLKMSRFENLKMC
jgi:hypothetical protein